MRKLDDFLSRMFLLGQWVLFRCDDPFRNCVFGGFGFRVGEADFRLRGFSGFPDEGPSFSECVPFPSDGDHVSGQFRVVEGFQFPSAGDQSVGRFQFPGCSIPEKTAGPSDGFSYRPSACGGFHGISTADGFIMAA